MKIILPTKITLIALIILLVSFFTLESLPLNLSNLTQDKIEIKLPFNFNGKKDQVYIYEADISHNTYSSSFLKIIPDDCLEELYINDVKMSLKNISGLCDWNHGFVFDAKNYLQEGDNHIALHVKNKDTIGGLNIITLQDTDSFLYNTLNFFIITSLIVVLFSFLQKQSINIELSILLIGALLLQLGYLSYTSFDTRTFDAVVHSGHLDYIKMIADKFTLPNPTEGWEYHQPPLYYISAAIFYKLASLSGFVDKYLTLQLFSLASYFIFMLYSVKIFTLVIPNRYTLFFASMLLVFWPSGVIHSIRIGNDILFYMLFSISLYYMILFQQNNKPIWITLFFASLALITKSNGIILFGILGLLLLIELIENRQYKHVFKNVGILFLFFFFAFSINFVDNIYYAIQEDGKDWLVSNVINTINKKLFVCNMAENYLYFDIKTYLTEPYIDAWNDKYGRQYFWNYLLKTSLFSEFFFNSTAHKTVASLISFLSLGIFTYMLLAIATLKKYQLKESMIFLLTLILSLAVLLAYRIKIPVACNTDFRYILPVLIPVGYFYALSLEWSKKQGYIVIEYVGYLQLTLFSLFSIIFFSL